MPTPPFEAPSEAHVKAARRTDIQGLRAVAVLLVVLAHAHVPFVPGGFVGVDVFFVLSGFLITGLLLAEARKNGSVSLLEFYVRRARRILPAAALTLLVTNVAVYFVLNFVRAREAVQDDLQAAAFSANFRFAARGVDYFAQNAPPSPVLHYWSLSVEEQFYFVWPLLLSLALFGIAVLRRGTVICRERRLIAVVLLVTAASLGWSIHLTATNPTAAYFSPFARAWELGLGASVAVCASVLARTPAAARMAMGWAGVVAIGVAAVVFSEKTPFPGSAGLLPTVGTALAIIAGMGSGSGTRGLSVSRLLSLRPMLIVGDRSYAFYLWHWPVLILAGYLAGGELSASAKLALVAGAFLLSCISYALIENPIHRKVRGRKTTALVVAVCMAGVLATAGASLAGIDRAQQRFEGPGAAVAPLRFGSSEASTEGGALPSVIAAVAAARSGAAIPSPLAPGFDHLKGPGGSYGLGNDCIGHNRSSVSKTKICRLGSGRRLVVLMGDSHALMWLPAVRETARRAHWKVVPLIRLGCMPAKWTSRYGNASCKAWYRWAISQVRRLRPRITFLGGSVDEQMTPFTQAAISGMVTAEQTLRGQGAVVIGDPEGLDQDPVDCLLAANASMATCTTTWPASDLVAYDEIARRVHQAGGRFLRTRGFVAYQRQSPAVIDDTIVWADSSSHLTYAYSAHIAAAFQAGLRSANRAAHR